VVLIPTFPVFLSTNSNCEDVPTEKSELDAGVVEPTESTPANVDVAVVEVATIAVTCGVDDETRLPDPSVVMTMLAPIPEIAKFVAKRLVNVPEVENKFVVVAEVPVALVKVKFWRVVEPRAFSVPDGKI